MRSQSHPLHRRHRRPCLRCCRDRRHRYPCHRWPGHSFHWSSRHSRPHRCPSRRWGRAVRSRSRQGRHRCHRRCRRSRACHQNRCPCRPFHIHRCRAKSCPGRSGIHLQPPPHILPAGCRPLSSNWGHRHRLHRHPRTKSAPSAACHHPGIRHPRLPHSRQVDCRPSSWHPDRRLHRHPSLRTTWWHRYKIRHPWWRKRRSCTPTHPCSPHNCRCRCPRWHQRRSCSPHCPCSRNLC